MNKMAKGAMAIGVGAALLLGGGGTLATWNATENASAGSISAGDLSLVNAAKEGGQWTNAAGTPVDIASYKVVPGDVLTYTQKMKMTLSGNLMTAKLTVANAGLITNTFGSEVSVDLPTITNAKGAVISGTTVLTPADSGEVTASAKFTFKDVTGDTGKNASAAFSAVQFKLDQVAPAATPAPTK